ncbi:MAG: nitrilase-related carbon-nitrogen hydrolase [Vampirovibrionia bacterium]
MSRIIRVLGVQVAPDTTDKNVNLDKMEKMLEDHSWFKPDIVVLPEVFNVGIVSPARAIETAESVPGVTYDKLSSWASSLNTYMIGGSIIEMCSDGKCRNNSMLFDRNGKLLCNYYKQHMFNYYGSNEGEFNIAGEETVLAKTDIANIGLTVCFDLRFTELYRTLAENGAEIIVVPAAWPYPRLDHWVTLNKARAIENSCFIVAVNQVGSVPPKRINAGNSMIIDPWGGIVAGCGEKETVMMAEIDLDQVSKLREEFPLLRDRNMKAYKNLKIHDTTTN